VQFIFIVGVWVTEWLMPLTFDNASLTSVLTYSIKVDIGA